jgi:hypothetical protein
MTNSKACLKEGHCYHCGRKLKESVCLDLNNLTSQWSSKGWPADESQGWFEFGRDCAKKLDSHEQSLGG